MAAVTFQLTGFSELNAALKDLGPKVANKIASRAMKDGAEVIAARARAIVSVSDNEEPHIKDNIITLVLSADGTSKRHAQVGFTEAVRWRAHFLEFGTQEAKNHKPTIAKPFLRPALDYEGQTAIEVMGDSLGEDIETAASGYPLGRR